LKLKKQQIPNTFSFFQNAIIFTFNFQITFEIKKQVKQQYPMLIFFFVTNVYRDFNNNKKMLIENNISFHMFYFFLLFVDQFSLLYNIYNYKTLKQNYKILKQS
jgi:hypothetical protein